MFYRTLSPLGPLPKNWTLLNFLAIFVLFTCPWELLSGLWGLTTPWLLTHLFHDYIAMTYKAVSQLSAAEQKKNIRYLIFFHCILGFFWVPQVLQWGPWETKSSVIHLHISHHAIWELLMSGTTSRVLQSRKVGVFQSLSHFCHFWALKESSNGP